MAVNDLGRRLGEVLADGGVKNNKVRNILNSFQVILETWDGTGHDERQRQIVRLEPNLRYLAARETDSRSRAALEALVALLGRGVEMVVEPVSSASDVKARFTTLVDLVEAITAYHRVKAPL